MLPHRADRPQPTRRSAVAAAAGFALAVLVGLTGCGAEVSDPASSTAATTAASTASTTASTAASSEAAAGSAVAVPRILDFSAPLVGGGTFSGAAQAGRPTVFWFWAPT